MLSAACLLYVYSCNALSARFFAVDRAINSYFMIMIMITIAQLWSIVLTRVKTPKTLW